MVQYSKTVAETIYHLIFKNYLYNYFTAWQAANITSLTVG